MRSSLIQEPFSLLWEYKAFCGSLTLGSFLALNLEYKAVCGSRARTPAVVVMCQQANTATGILHEVFWDY